jgi:hypothetical protein
MKAQRKLLSPLGGKLKSFISAVRLAIRINLGTRNVLQLMFVDIDGLVKGYTQDDAFCCPIVVV